jgi:TorA maturation chaperone TorD
MVACEGDFVTTCEGVALVGQILGPFFLEEPTKESMTGLVSTFEATEPAVLAEAWPFVGVSDAAGAFGLMYEGLAETSSRDAATKEFRRLFVGPGKKAAPPWGSVYTDHECVVFGETTLKLRRWMRDNGVARTSDEKTPEDHIGLMLGLMSWLASNRPELLDEYLSDHLLIWAPHFLEELYTAARHSLYQGLARVTSLTLEGIRQARGLKVETPKFYR